MLVRNFKTYRYIKLLFFCILCFIAFFTYSNLQYKQKVESLKKNWKLDTALCTGLHFLRNSGYELRYRYVINNNIFYGEKSIDYSLFQKEKARNMIGKKCLLIYDTLKMKSSCLMLFDSDFNFYEVDTNNSRQHH